jgi:Transcription factor zinc-finger
MLAARAAHNGRMPDSSSATTAVACPRCQAPMAVLALEAHYGQRLELDDCAACRVAWFDARELMRLSPEGWRALLRHLAEGAHADPAPVSLGAMRCPHCAVNLAAQQDLTRFGAFPMKACPAGHGRAQGHASLLASRGLFRRLLPDERASLAQEQRHFDCLGCGAPQDGHADACSHCGTASIVVDWPRLAEALGLQPAADAGDVAGQRRWACHGCGASLDPIRQTRCPQCLHPVLAADLPTLLPWLEGAALAPAASRAAPLAQDALGRAASREALQPLVAGDAERPSLREGVRRTRLQVLGGSALVATVVWGPWGLLLWACLGYALLVRRLGDHAAAVLTALGSGAALAWAWRGRVLTADGDPAWWVLLLMGGVVGWGLARCARGVYRWLLA